MSLKRYTLCLSDAFSAINPDNIVEIYFKQIRKRQDNMKIIAILVVGASNIDCPYWCNSTKSKLPLPNIYIKNGIIAE
jgi:hypothetical protein